MSGYFKRDTDPFPVHKLKRVDRPTTEIMGDKVQRVDERESGFNRAGRGDFGPVQKKEEVRLSRLSILFPVPLCRCKPTSGNLLMD